MPQDLYIPPDALEVILEAFEGPLDLLLYLIRRQNLDILDIPVAEITRQYVDYIDVLQDLRFELAAEYLVMAAILAEIKSRMLLPRAELEEGIEGDPRAELVRRLQEYERFKKAAEGHRRSSTGSTATPAWPAPSCRSAPRSGCRPRWTCAKCCWRCATCSSAPTCSPTTRSPASLVGAPADGRGARRLADGSFHLFENLFNAEEGRIGVVVTFLLGAGTGQGTVARDRAGRRDGPIDRACRAPTPPPGRRRST
jgi:segregation and condensation protein A